MTPLSHIATALVKVPAAEAFDFMADPAALGRWSLGCMETAPAGPDGVYSGRSLFDGGRGWFHIEALPEAGRILYHVGSEHERQPRIEARIVDGAPYGYGDGCALVSLIAWRTAEMDDSRWHRLVASHEAEILLIASQCETRLRAAR